MLKHLLRAYSFVFPFSDFLYILQLEEYDTLRYFNRLKSFFLRRNLQKRGKLIYTRRVKITFAFSFLPGLVLPILIPFFVGLSNIFVSPYFSFLKNKIQNDAKRKFQKMGKNTKVIAIAGSYGKTTTKNYIYEFIRYNYKTQMIPGNINTPTGIAMWILKNFREETEILIVEVDTYFVGEIKKSLAITPPDVCILTNIGDQHLERFKNKAELSRALNEVFVYAKNKAIKIKNLSSSLEYALRVARLFKIPEDIVNDTILKLSPPDRRRNLTKIGDFEVIDDSYNISETTAREGIFYAKNLAKKKGKSLLVITAGIPELGKENCDANKNLGKILSNSASYVILLRSKFYKEISAEIKNKKKITYTDSMEEALNKLFKFDNKKTLVLMQPELNDLYY